MTSARTEGGALYFRVLNVRGNLTLILPHRHGLHCTCRHLQLSQAQDVGKSLSISLCSASPCKSPQRAGDEADPHGAPPAPAARVPASRISSTERGAVETQSDFFCAASGCVNSTWKLAKYASRDNTPSHWPTAPHDISSSVRACLPGLLRVGCRTRPCQIGANMPRVSAHFTARERAVDGKVRDLMSSKSMLIACTYPARKRTPAHDWCTKLCAVTGACPEITSSTFGCSGMTACPTSPTAATKAAL